MIGHLSLAKKHWVALTVDGKAKQLGYGDSLGNKIPERISTAFNWWISKHSNKPFMVMLLPTMKQTDGFLCGTLSKVMLENVINKTCPMNGPYDACAAQMTAFIGIANTILEEVS